MPHNLPVGASGSRDSERRPREIPRKIKEACTAMIYGAPDDVEGKPIDLVAASRIAGIQPKTLRDWLHKPVVTAFIRRERAAYRTALCCGNESALQRARDRSLNGMVTVAAVRALEQIDDAEPYRRTTQESPRLTINIVSAPPPTAPVTIEHPPLEPDPTIDRLPEPKFRWPPRD